jgi:beta-lactam-binding protein with PASTA domain
VDDTDAAGTADGAEATAVVPALVGLEVGDAHDLAMGAGVVVVSADPVEPLPATGTVTAQTPLAGLTVPPASPVSVLVERRGRGGGTPVPTPPLPVDAVGT